MMPTSFCSPLIISAQAIKLLQHNNYVLSRLSRRYDKITPFEGIQHRMKIFVDELWLDYNHPGWREDEDD